VHPRLIQIVTVIQPVPSPTRRGPGQRGRPIKLSCVTGTRLGSKR
jgi:hypothetical protein